MSIKAKLIKGHRKGCDAVSHAIKGDWDNPWAFIAGEEVYLDKGGGNRGRGRGCWRWRKVVCNDPDCPAVAIIREADILNSLEFKP